MKQRLLAFWLLLLSAAALLPAAPGFGIDFRPPCPAVTDREIQLARSLEATYAAQQSAPDPASLGSQSAIRSMQASDIIPGQYIVAYAPGFEAEARRLADDRGAKVIGMSQAGGDFLVLEFDNRAPDSREATIRSLQARFVRSVEPVIRYHTCYHPDDPGYAANGWDKYAMYSDRAWDFSTGSHNIKVAVVDEGIDYTHPDLSGNFDPGLKGYDFVDHDNDPRPANANEAHATHVAGIIAATINNALGTAGWANITLLSCRALDSSGSGTNQDIADAMRYAADQGARIINLSLGSTSPSSVMQQAVEYAWGRNALVIAASGNNGTSGVFYPAAYSSAIAVGALSTNGQVADFSDYGPELDLIAPGVNIFSTVPNGQYEFMAGTSMATPEVSGAAALLLSYKPTLSNAAARAALEASAIDMGNPGLDPYYGNGLLNVYRAMLLAAAMSRKSPAPSTQHPTPVTQFAIPSLVHYGQTIDLVSTPSTQHLTPAFPVQYQVFDNQGRLARAGSGSLTVDLAPGVYFISCRGSTPHRVTVVPR